ncbi:hypothetical protein C2I27_04330 [Priestia megaterium]|jgi:phi LC3 family holin|uniref:phage holin n=1 Tax=Priestia megaterium TaxID=1404 RepID=UPI000D512DC3|nr:phage holin [Priestia megaterium]PVC75119.1 hypothetical protein C2I27_04330 [Priestia megaterium]
MKKEKRKKRIKTTVFWGAIASAVLIFIQNIAAAFGYEISAETMTHLIAAVNSLLAILSLSGLLVNPKEVDSFQAMVTKVKK